VRRVPSGGAEAGPKLMSKVARERMEMRDEQMSFGFKALLLRLSLAALSLAIWLLL